MREATKLDTSFQHHAVRVCSGHYLQHLLEIGLVTYFHCYTMHVVELLNYYTNY